MAQRPIGTCAEALPAATCQGGPRGCPCTQARRDVQSFTESSTPNLRECCCHIISYTV